VKIRWYGHACFLIQSGDKVIVTDPFDETVGYSLPDIKPDLVLESHQHFDHNAHHLLKGDFQIIKDDIIEGEVKGFKIEGYNSFHDDEQGKKRGNNIIFKITTPEGFRIVHLGDLGAMPSEDVVNSIMNPDILLVPAGGKYTFEPDTAAGFSKQLKPKIIVPMHFKTEVISDWPIKTVDDFLSYFEDHQEKDLLVLETPGDLKDYELDVVVLDYEAKE
jgi:L-ascorbate metabolism protein UlaG (beta-lactamase superfamily)